METTVGQLQGGSLPIFWSAGPAGAKTEPRLQAHGQAVSLQSSHLIASTNPGFKIDATPDELRNHKHWAVSAVIQAASRPLQTGRDGLPQRALLVSAIVAVAD